MGPEVKIDRLLEAVRGADEVLILPHNDPDPDAIASALALQLLLKDKAGVDSYIVYQGLIGRAENKALVRYLGRPLRHLKCNELESASAIALVDTQPGAGNNALPPDTDVIIVLDHHPPRQATAEAAFADVRPGLGATSTLLVQHLRAAGIEPPVFLATALFYGVKTDTMGLARATKEDVEAYFYLQPRIDVEALVGIEQAQVPAEYFERLAATLKDARVHDGVVISYVGPMNRPDLTAEMADLLLRLEGTRWVICFGAYKGNLITAVRTWSRTGKAEKLAQAIVGNRRTAGGHDSMAGGQIPLDGEPPERAARRRARRALEYLDISPEKEGEPLI